MRHARALLFLLAAGGLAGCGATATGPSGTAARPIAPSTEPTAKPATSAPRAEASTGCPPGMVTVPGGLLRGEPVSTLCVDVHEVTVSEYAACEKNKACPPLPREVRLLSAVSQAEQDALSEMCSARLSDNADLPATCVSQREANVYCAWKGERLPTEAEWEWIATGGEDKLPWPWGTALPSDSNVCWQRQRGPCNVSGKPAGAFEVMGMAGNAAEWTATAAAPVGGKPAPDARKVVRGGSWESTKEADVSPNARSSRPEDYRDVTIGFRCVLSR